MSFEAVLDELKNELYKADFDIGAITVYYKAKNISGRVIDKYHILHVYDHFLYNEMMKIALFEGIIMPCTITVLEKYPGQVAIVPYNATEMIVKEISKSNAAKFSNRSNKAIKSCASCFGKIANRVSGPRDLLGLKKCEIKNCIILQL